MTDISILIIAICMVFLLIFVVVLIFGLLTTIKKIGHTVESLETKVTPLIEEATKALANTTEITASIKTKVDSTDPLFSSIAKVGSIVEMFVSKVPTPTSEARKPFVFFEEKSSTFNDWAEMAGLGLILLKKFKERMEK